MPVNFRHPLVSADLQRAFDWYEDKLPGLGDEFGVEFRLAMRKFRKGPLLYAVRISNVRRLNLLRFDYGIFYVVYPNEIRLLAVLHASQDTCKILAHRRRFFFLN